MPRLPKQNYHDIERIIEMDFLRATEAAALNSLKWLGRGDKEAADAAASDAIRGMFDLMNICGEVVIGEGIKDNAPGIFKGEQLGTWLPGTPQFDIAIDPIDGTTNISKGAPNSISCIAAASPEEGVKVALRDVPSFYMTKLSYGPRVIQYMQRRGDNLKLEAPIPETLAIVARAVDKRVQDIVVMMLDRPRHKETVDEIRGADFIDHFLVPRAVEHHDDDVLHTFVHRARHNGQRFGNGRLQFQIIAPALHVLDHARAIGKFCHVK